MFKRLKAQAGRINLNEIYTLALLTFGVPYIFYIYLSWKEALAVFIIVQIVLGIIRARE